MKARLIVLVISGAIVAAIGAGNALGAIFVFNGQTGRMEYDANDADGPANFVNHITVSKSDQSGYTLIVDSSSARAFIDSGVTQYCFEEFGGYACPAASIRVYGHTGNDSISVDSAVTLPTSLEGGLGNDTIHGGGGKDTEYGGCTAAQCADSGADHLYGGAGNDPLHADSGGDTLSGQSGNDTLDGGPGADLLYGGADADTADYSARGNGIVVHLDAYANDGETGEHDTIESDVEAVQGGGGNDVLYGNDSANTLKGGPGDDYMDTAGGNDYLYGQSGEDLLRGGFGADYLSGGSMPNGCCEADTASWAGRTNPVYASIDGQAFDGESGEHDYVASDVENLTGGNGTDTLTGDKYGNLLQGGSGNDTLNGKGTTSVNGLTAVDDLRGGSGNDALSGGPLASYYDQIDGGTGTDSVSYETRTAGLEIWMDGSSGEDHIVNVETARGGAGNDLIVGNGSPNTLYGNGGNDTLAGMIGDDDEFGGDGNDQLLGEEGHDILVGQAAADSLDGGADDDYLSGGDGIDTATYASDAVPVNVTLDGAYNDGASGEGDNVLVNVEDVIGGSAGDFLTGNSAANTFTGGAGADHLNGAGGADLLDGGDGADVLNGQDGADTLAGGAADDALHGGAGADSLQGGPDGDTLDGGGDVDTVDYLKAASGVAVDLSTQTATGEGADTLNVVENATGSAYVDQLTGGPNSNVLAGGAGTDTIKGGGGNDSIYGGAGNDLLHGELGDDMVDGGTGIDTAIYTSSTSGVVVDLSSFVGTSSGGQGSDTLTTMENVDGSAHDDTLTGSSGPNVLHGFYGDDQLNGLAGDDQLNGGPGTDMLDGGLGTDSCAFGESLSNCE